MTRTVTLIRPPVDVLHKFSKPVECLALGYLGAAVRSAGHDAVLLDGMMGDWTIQESADRILATAPDIVGITVVLNHLPPQVEQISALLRQGGFSGPILVGGHSVSFFPEQVLRAAGSVDAVICGEGELPIQDVVTALDAGRRWQDAPGVTYRDGTAMSTSRGCYARCNFCSIPRFYGLERGGKGLASGDWLGRDPASMAAEVLHLHEEFGLVELLIVDDEFFGGNPAGVERAVRFVDLLAAADSPVGLALSFRAENADPALLARLYAGGLRHCFIGLESGVDSDLKLYGKAHSADQNRRAVEVVKDLGMSFQPGFMMFHYDSTIDQLRRNMAFLRDIGECKPVTVNSSVDPHFGTPLLRVMRRENVVSDHGTAMTMRYKNPRVAVAKEIAHEAAVGFQEFMNVIAGVQSAITYECRRPVPGRQPEVRSVIDAFEKRVNETFVQVVDEALDALDGATDPADVAGAARERLTAVHRELSVGRSLLMLFLQQREGGVSYRTQRDLIAARVAAS